MKEGIGSRYTYLAQFRKLFHSSFTSRGKKGKYPGFKNRGGDEIISQSKEKKVSSRFTLLEKKGGLHILPSNIGKKKKKGRG